MLVEAIGQSACFIFPDLVVVEVLPGAVLFFYSVGIGQDDFDLEAITGDQLGQALGKIAAGTADADQDDATNLRGDVLFAVW